MASRETVIDRSEKPSIPKSKELFAGDINDAVIQVQQITGFEITPGWWMEEVGNTGTTEEILDKFDAAFERFVHSEMGMVEPTETGALPEQITSEADAEVLGFDSHVVDEPGLAPLREEFLEALTDHLKQKYFVEAGDQDVILSESKGYSAEIRSSGLVAEVKIIEGECPEGERFLEVNDLPICNVLGAHAAIDAEGHLTQTIPTVSGIDSLHSRAFGIEPNYLMPTQVETQTPEIDAKTYWGHLAEGVIPIAGTEDTNYFIHDRAVDDHVLGWLVSPDELNAFIRGAGQSISSEQISRADAQDAIAAYDFLTSTLTLYAWRRVNGEQAPLPLRGDVASSVESQRIEAVSRLGYAPAAIEQMISNIEKISGVTLEISIDELLVKIDERADRLSAIAGSK